MSELASEDLTSAQQFGQAIRERIETAGRLPDDVEAQEISRVETDEIPAPPTDEPADAAAPEGRERDDQGRFVKKEKLLGKFDDVDALAKSYMEVESEKGRLASELGELRAQILEMRDQMRGTDQETPALDRDRFEKMLEDDAQRAAMEALEVGDVQAFARAIDEWGQYDPAGAMKTYMGVMTQALREEFNRGLEQRLAPFQTDVQERQRQDALAAFARENPAVKQMLPDLEGVAAEFPSIQRDLRDPDPQTQVQALTQLLRIAQARQPASPAVEAEVPYVAPATGRQAPAARSEADRIRDAILSNPLAE